MIELQYGLLNFSILFLINVGKKGIVTLKNVPFLLIKYFYLVEYFYDIILRNLLFSLEYLFNNHLFLKLIEDIDLQS